MKAEDMLPPGKNVFCHEKSCWKSRWKSLSLNWELRKSFNSFWIDEILSWKFSHQLFVFLIFSRLEKTFVQKKKKNIKTKSFLQSTLLNKLKRQAFFLLLTSMLITITSNQKVQLVLTRWFTTMTTKIRRVQRIHRSNRQEIRRNLSKQRIWLSNGAASFHHQNRFFIVNRRTFTEKIEIFSKNFLNNWTLSVVYVWSIFGITFEIRF